MPWHVAALRENHGPGDVRRAAIQLTIDEISNTSETEPDGCNRTSQIGNIPEIPVPPPRNPYRGQDHSNESAVEGHTALPNGKDGERLLQVAAEIIENHVAQASSDHYPKDQVKKEVVQIVRGHIQLPVLRITA